MEETKLASAIAKTCRQCQVSNLLEEVKVARCTKCEGLYCVHFASNIDPSQCVECLSDVTLHKEVIVKTYTHESYDEESDTTTTTQYRRRAKSLRLEGMDWLFAQRKITTMSDDSLEMAIEYHREILQGMLHEREDRKAKFLHRYAGIKHGTETVNVGDGTTSNTTTTVKKSKVISSTKAAATVSAVAQSLLNQGMDPAALLKMLQDMQKGVK